jgi:hypothetical protein
VLDKTWWVWSAFVLVFGTFVVLIFMQLQRPDAFPGGAEPPGQAAGDPSGTTGPSEGEEEAPTGEHNIGVWYDEGVRRWAIFNQDLADMEEGTSFDVHVLSDESAFVHQATVENTVEDGTYLNDPLTNANPDAVLSVTQNWNPGGAGGTYNDHPVGVRYDAGVRSSG